MDISPGLGRLYWLAACRALRTAGHGLQATLRAMCPCGTCGGRP